MTGYHVERNYGEEFEVFTGGQVCGSQVVYYNAYREQATRR